MRLKTLSLVLPLCLASSAAQSIQRAGGYSGADTDEPVRSEDYLWAYFETPLSYDVTHNGGRLIYSKFHHICKITYTEIYEMMTNK